MTRIDDTADGSEATFPTGTPDSTERLAAMEAKTPGASPARVTPTLTGEEPLRSCGRPVGGNVLGFWRWSASELLGNALRGRFAEYIVAIAAGASAPFREEWDVVDLVMPDGTTIEIKSASYLQSWAQKRHSSISFDIAPKLAWDESSGYGSHFGRAADVYVFCVLAHRDMATVDPLDLGQWEFHVLATSVINASKPLQKTITLGSLLRLGPASCGFDELGDRIRAAGVTAGASRNQDTQTIPRRL